MSICWMTRPDGSRYAVESCDDVVTHAVDASGVYLGLVALGVGQAVPSEPPVGTHWRWVAGAWAWRPPLADRLAEALAQIDAAAGQVRLAYITDVPGQEGTYLLKDQQAREYLAALATDPQAAVPPFVQAEADAMQTTPQLAAQGIVATSAVWMEQLAPAIERERRRGKLAADAAADETTLAAALDAALAALNALLPESTP